MLYFNILADTGTSSDSEETDKISSNKRKRRKKRKNRSGSDSSTDSSVGDRRELLPASVAASNWNLLASIWPVRDRPENLQREDVVNAIDFSTLLGMAKYKQESSVGAAGGGSKAAFTKDSLPENTYFKEARDNGVKRLHDERFLRLPLTDPKKWWHRIPLNRSHKYKNIPLKFMGCQGQIAEKTIDNAHDRSNAHLLKHFFSENIGINAKPFKKIERKDEDGLSTVFDYLWEEPSTLSHIQDAIVNYQATLHHLWPMDPTAIILLKVLNKYKWINSGDSLKDKVAACTSFFNSVMRENAGRAVRGETVMNFNEQELLLKDILAAHGISGSVPIGRIPKLDPPKPNFNKKQDKLPRQSSGKKPAQNTNKFQVARLGNLGCCYSFNDNVCHNTTKTTAGCKDSMGREFAHNCNRFLANKQAHCLGDHPRHKHV